MGRKVLFFIAILSVAIFSNLSAKTLGSQEDAKAKFFINQSDEQKLIVIGKLINEEGKPFTKATINVNNFEAWPNKNGYFRLEVPKTEKYTIRITPFNKKYLPYKIKKFINNTNIIDLGIITIKKNKICYIAGKVTDKKGKPIEYCSVKIKELGISSITDGKGRYRIFVKKPGYYHIIAYLMGYEKQEIDVRVNPSETTVLNFKLNKKNIKKKAVVKVKKSEHTKKRYEVVVKNVKVDDSDEVSDDSDDADGHKIKSLGIVNAKTLKELRKENDKENEENIKILKFSPGKVEKLKTSSGPKVKKIQGVRHRANETSNPLLEELSKVRKRRGKADKELEEIKKLTGEGKGYDHSRASSSKSKLAFPKNMKSGLRASFVDDNKQFNYYLDYLKRFENRVQHYNLAIKDRFIFKFKDKDGNSLPDVKVNIKNAKGKLLESGLTYSDGTYLFFASMYQDKNFVLKAEYNNKKITKHFSIQDKRISEITFDNIGKKPVKSIPLDLLFIFDTTGSMGEEIERLKQTIEIINMNLLSFDPKPDIRLGMVLYKDIMDVYDTKIIPFTSDFKSFNDELHRVVSSGGGGDGPEDLQRALKDAMQKMKWREKGLKIAFIITDAPPHLYPDEKDYKYTDAAIEAKNKGIKLYSIGTGGLNNMGEYVLRQLSQFTYANYIFLTYGEKGESEGGRIGSVSHHTGENFTTDTLDAILIQTMKRELQLYSGQKIKTDEYFEANPVENEDKKQTLDILFSKAIKQLYDYSTIKIEKDTPTAISPISCQNSDCGATSEYFTENLQLALVKTKLFKAVERKDLQPVLKELKFQLDELADESKAAELGKFIGANLLITGKMYEKENSYEIYLKLLNVETVEILSVTKLVVNKKLGL